MKITKMKANYNSIFFFIFSYFLTLEVIILNIVMVLASYFYVCNHFIYIINLVI